jgi:RNA polymerase subunit RPABC4/transcription elongation factor Spt4
MVKKSFFKTIFWILTALVAALITGVAALMAVNISADPDFPGYMIVYFVLVFAVIAAVMTALAVFTYRDARKHGMDPWMWVTIVVFVPNLIGLIIYLITRSNSQKAVCPTCRRPVGKDFTLCPYCGSAIESKCPGCGRGVSVEWNLCPYCSAKLK